MTFTDWELKLRHTLNIFILTFTLVVGACSTNYSTLDGTSEGYQRIYAMTEQEALATAHRAILQSFPGLEITTIDGPTKGYSTYTRFVLDTFTQQVLIDPVVGTTANGLAVNGYSFEVSGSGSSGSGAIRNGNFFKLLQSELENSGKGVEVVSVRPRPSAASPTAPTVSSPIDQIARLKELLDHGAITVEEYEVKKAELLNRL